MGRRHRKRAGEPATGLVNIAENKIGDAKRNDIVFVGYCNIAHIAERMK
jgi:hypothetical protein